MNQVDELGQRGPSMKMLHKFSQLAISGKMWAYQLGITKYYLICHEHWNPVTG